MGINEKQIHHVYCPHALLSRNEVVGILQTPTSAETDTERASSMDRAGSPSAVPAARWHMRIMC